MWESEMHDKYPKTLKGLSYFEINEGWKELVEEITSKIEVVNNKYSPSSYIRAAQVKQKFGGLRYYISIEEIDEQDVRYVYDMIAEAEKRSFTICEYCGSPANTSRDRPYVETLCDEHRTSRR
jgi:uncharacterized protein YfkK (UPF0435 family)